MLVGWDEYLKLSNACDTFHECCRRCRPAFEQHRRNIQCAVEITRPKTVACLGPGALNDIPYEFMVRLGASIHLVDWTLLSSPFCFRTFASARRQERTGQRAGSSCQ